MIPEDIRFIAIQNYGSSGTTLLHSLFDSHPNILQMPGLYARGLYEFWLKNNHLDINQFIDLFFTKYQMFFSAELVDDEFGFKQMGENKDEVIAVDQNKFEDYFRNNFKKENFNSKEFIIKCHLSYEHSLGRLNINKKVIVYPLHTIPADEYRLMFQDFPNLKIINMVRHPISLYYSSLKHFRSMHLRNKVFFFNFTEATLSFLLNDFYYVRDKKYPHFTFRYFPEINKSQHIAVLLEDLHANPELVTKSLARWLNISWSKTMLESTFNGKKWWNRKESIRVNGFIQNAEQLIKNKSGWRIDEVRIKSLARNQINNWGYSNIEPVPFKILITLFIPFKSELNSLIYRFHQLPRIIKRKISRKKFIQNLRKSNKFKLNSVIKNKKKEVKFFLLLLYLISLFIMPFYIIKDYFKIRLILLKAFIYAKNIESNNIIKKINI